MSRFIYIVYFSLEWFFILTDFFKAQDKDSSPFHQCEVCGRSERWQNNHRIVPGMLYWTPYWWAPSADRDDHHKAHSLSLEIYWLCNHRVAPHNGVLCIINQTTKITVSNYKNLKADSPTQNMLSQKNEE